MNYESTKTVASSIMPGVKFGLRRISFRGRLELLRAVRQVSGRQDFAAAGESLADRLEAAVLEHELDEIYLRWGLVGIEGLELDGNPATIDTLLAHGPENLCQEVLAAIKQDCGLTESEAKN